MLLFPPPQLLKLLSPRSSTTSAELPQNRNKNRYTNILPCTWTTMFFYLFYELFFFDKHLCTHIACCQPLSFSGVSSLQSLPFKVHQPPPLFVLHPSYPSHPVILCLSTEPMLPAHIHRLIFLSHLPLKCSSSLHPPSNFVASFSIFFTSFFPGAKNYRIFDFLPFDLYLEFSVTHVHVLSFLWSSTSS